jgi:hypothetical protein
MPTWFRKDYLPTYVMVFHTVFTAEWLLFPHTLYSTSIFGLGLIDHNNVRAYTTRLKESHQQASS